MHRCGADAADEDRRQPVKIVPYLPEHALRIKLQKAQQEDWFVINQDYANSLSGGPAFTALEGDEVIACGGYIHEFGNWIMWALLSDKAKNHMVRLSKVAARLMTMSGETLWTVVTHGFDEGTRWVKMFGFEYRDTKPVEQNGHEVILDIYERAA